VHAVADLLFEALLTKSWDEAKRLLKCNPSLLSGKMGAAIGRRLSVRADARSYSGLSDGERDFCRWMDRTAVDLAEEEYRQLFRRCRDIGVDGAFWEAGKTGGGEKIRKLRDAAESTHLSDDYIEELDLHQTRRALRAWRRMAAKDRFDDAPVTLQRQILRELDQLVRQMGRFEGGSARLARESIDVCRRLIATHDEGASELGEDAVRLGNAWWDFFEVTGEREALEMAVASYGDAVNAGGDFNPHVGWSLGSALARRHEFTRQPDDLSAAVEWLEASLPALRRDEDFVDFGNLAIALLQRYSRFGSRRDLNRAIQLLSENPDDSGPVARNNLATALLERYEASGAEGDLLRARDLLRAALAATPRGARERPSRLANLLGALGQGPRSRKSTREAHRLAAEIQALPTSVNPGDTLAALRSWGAWCANAADWKQATAAFDRALGMVEAIVSNQRAASHQADWLAAASGVAMDAAYACARLGDAEAAALAFERGRAVQLRNLTVLGARIRPVRTFEELRRAAAGTAIVMICSRSWGGCAIVIRAAEPAEIVWLRELTSDALSARLSRYLAAYRRREDSPKSWDEAIDRLTRWLGHVVMAPILACGLGSRAILVAGGRLGILPLHAAWTASGQRGRRWYALDQVTLSYAPSVAAVLFAGRRLRSSSRPDSAVAIADPGAGGRTALPMATLEAQHALLHFSRATMLHGTEARRPDVVQALREHQVWHFACHGFAASEIEKSHLELADNETLAVADIAGLSPFTVPVRLAVLSACETGVIDGRVPDEVQGWPSELMRAGLPGVIASIWAVAAGASTAALMARFYELWRGEGLEPAHALREAQRWLRDSSNGEKRDRFPRLVKEPRGLTKEKRERWARHRSHRAPYFWAPFELIGL
jgi:CHAT domain-containing protein/tetratricopeptide (TPR) repeat protein